MSVRIEVFSGIARFHCSSNAFELNNSINHGKTRVSNIIYLLPLNSLFNSRSLPPFKMLKLYIVQRYVSLLICLAWWMIDHRFHCTVGLIVLLKVRHFWAHWALKYDTFRSFSFKLTSNKRANLFITTTELWRKEAKYCKCDWRTQATTITDLTIIDAPPKEPLRIFAPTLYF